LADEQVEALAGEFSEVLPDGGQGWQEELCFGDVIEADDADLVRDVQAVLGESRTTDCGCCSPAATRRPTAAGWSRARRMPCGVLGHWRQLLQFSLRWE
jgi:hypothetical protein